jgi:hypothetical protein
MVTTRARAVLRDKLGTNRTTQYHPTLTNINRYLRRPPAVPNAEALVRVLSAALHQQTRRSSTKHPLAGRVASRIAVHKHGGAGPGVDKGVASRQRPQGLPRAVPPGASSGKLNPPRPRLAFPTDRKQHHSGSVARRPEHLPRPRGPGFGLGPPPHRLPSPSSSCPGGKSGKLNPDLSRIHTHNLSPP